jgi:hypothetical protein
MKGGHSMNDCQKISKIMSVYIDGESTKEESKAVETHISSCSKCKTEFDAMVNVKFMLNHLPDEELPSNYATTLHEKLVALEKPKLSRVPMIYKTLSIAASFAIIGFYSFYFLSPLPSRQKVALMDSFTSHSSVEKTDNMPAGSSFNLHKDIEPSSSNEKSTPTAKVNPVDENSMDMKPIIESPLEGSSMEENPIELNPDDDSETFSSTQEQESSSLNPTAREENNVNSTTSISSPEIALAPNNETLKMYDVTSPETNLADTDERLMEDQPSDDEASESENDTMKATDGDRTKFHYLVILPIQEKDSLDELAESDSPKDHLYGILDYFRIQGKLQYSIDNPEPKSLVIQLEKNTLKEFSARLKTVFPDIELLEQANVESGERFLHITVKFQ